LAPASGLRRGAYVLSDATNGKPDVLLIGTGSEVSLCLNAQEALKKQGVEAQVISMPSWKLFEDQMRRIASQCYHHRSKRGLCRTVELVVACKNKRYIFKSLNESNGGQDFAQRRRDRGAE
jgi:transketolase